MQRPDFTIRYICDQLSIFAFNLYLYLFSRIFAANRTCPHKVFPGGKVLAERSTVLRGSACALRENALCTKRKKTLHVRLVTMTKNILTMFAVCSVAFTICSLFEIFFTMSIKQRTLSLILCLDAQLDNDIGPPITALRTETEKGGCGCMTQTQSHKQVFLTLL